MDKNKSHSIVILGVIMMFLILLVVFSTLLQPTYKKISSQNEELDRLKFQSGLLQKALDNKKEKGNLPEEEVQAALPLWDNTEQLVVSLKDIGQKTETKLTTVSFNVTDNNGIHTIIGSESPVYPNVKEVKVQAVVEGSYDGIRSWIVQMQKQERLIVIDSVRYSIPVGGLTSAEIAFTSYFDPSYGYLLENPVIPVGIEP